MREHDLGSGWWAEAEGGAGSPLSGEPDRKLGTEAGSIQDPEIMT